MRRLILWGAILALLKNSNPRETSGAYYRLFGIKELSLLISKIQSTVISSGTELEKIILSRVKQINDLDEFLEFDLIPEGIIVASKKAIKSSHKINSTGREPDFLIFKRKGSKQECIIVELKDGYMFDTKKASAERAGLYDFSTKNASKFQLRFKCYLCAFNETDKEKIHRGLKGQIAKEDILTGEEFCEILEINYQEILTLRTKDIDENIIFFVEELLKIKRIRELIDTKLNRGEEV